MKRLTKGAYYTVRVKPNSTELDLTGKPKAGFVYEHLKYLQTKESNTILVFEKHISGNFYEHLFFFRKGVEVEDGK